jgi:putative aldouronate transport system permease protein
MLIPGFFFLFIYKFIPLYGISIAFKDFNIFLGNNPFQAIAQSDWVGFDHFQRLFAGSQFLKVLSNTLIINFYKIIFLFPLPVITAIMLTEIMNKAYKKAMQTLIYIPYFFSWSIVFGIFYSLLGSYGPVNIGLKEVGLDSVMFFSDHKLFRGLLVFTEGWKEIGWNTVIYLAAITSIDPTLFEAAWVDGATKFQKIIHITIPGLFPTIILMLIMKIGHILDTGFEQILIMYNPAVYDVADVIQTYVYRMGLGQMDFSLGTALGLFNSLIAFILIISANAASRKLLGRSIW